MLKHLIEDELLLVKNVKASQKRKDRTFYVSKKHLRLQKMESF